MNAKERVRASVVDVCSLKSHKKVVETLRFDTSCSFGVF